MSTPHRRCTAAQRWRRMAALGYLCLAAWLAPSIAQARLPAHNPVPGGVAVVLVDLAGQNTAEQIPTEQAERKLAEQAAQSKQNLAAQDEQVEQNLAAPTPAAPSFAVPIVKFGGRRIMLKPAAQPGQWYAIVGLPLNIAPGEYLLSATSAERNFAVTFAVRSQAVGARNLMRLPNSLAKLSFASAAPKHRLRLNAELWRRATAPDFVFTPMVESARTLPHGLLINDRLPGRYVEHAGVTYFSAAHAVAYAPAAGVVHDIKRDRTLGTVVYINHGQGLASIISRLGETALKIGQHIARGQSVGVVKSVFGRRNGRVDWELLLNGNLVDPLQFNQP